MSNSEIIIYQIEDGAMRKFGNSEFSIKEQKINVYGNL